MSNNSKPRKEKIILNYSQMQKIARYELTFKEIINGAGVEDVDIICPEVYRFTLEDLAEALGNLMRIDPTVREFGEDWFYPITCMEAAFDLFHARGLLDDEDDTPEELKGYRNIMVSDSAWFDEIWWYFDTAWSDYDPDSQLSDGLNLDIILADLERYLSNKGKPILEWCFSKQEMCEYICEFDEDDRLRAADEKELLLCRSMIEELCEMDSTLALRIKGYACYGGNRLYACDWHTSRDCMLRLFEKTDDPQYANTLGYIFYYGRCTGGIPEFDKAFHYFEIAAANGLYEGAYKLADMYCHGYGCEKSPRTARALYGMVYDQNLKRFLQGENLSFADAALRMGNVYAKGIGEEKDPVSAYHFYLQADYAAKLRAQENDFFGNKTVVTNVQKALDEIRPSLPEDFFQEFSDTETLFYFEQLADDEHRCTLTRRPLENGDISLTAARVPTKARPEPEKILITLGYLNYCELVSELTVTTLQPSAIWFKDDADTIRYNYCTYDVVEDRYEFYYEDELVAWSKCEMYRFIPTAVLNA